MRQKLEYDFEDLDGKNPSGIPACFECIVECTVVKGEKSVPYYSDGSGYPGSPDVIYIDNLLWKSDVQLPPSLNKSITLWMTQYLEESEDFNIKCIGI